MLIERLKSGGRQTQASLIRSQYKKVWHVTCMFWTQVSGEKSSCGQCQEPIRSTLAETSNGRQRQDASSTVCLQYFLCFLLSGLNAFPSDFHCSSCHKTHVIEVGQEHQPNAQWEISEALSISIHRPRLISYEIKCVNHEEVQLIQVIPHRKQQNGKLRISRAETHESNKTTSLVPE